MDNNKEKKHATIDLDKLEEENRREARKERVTIDLDKLSEEMSRHLDDDSEDDE